MLYLDFMASSPICQPALDTWLYLSQNYYGNSSGANSFSIQANSYIEDCTDLLNALFNSDKVIYTSGATEANNLVIQSFQKEFDIQYPKTTHKVWPEIYTSAAEHNSILEPALIPTAAWRTTVLEVDKYGIPETNHLLDKLEKIWDKYYPVLISLMHVNNELGSVTNIKDIASRLKELDLPNIYFHVDASQSAGKLSIDMSWGIDFLTCSSHKFYGPKGVGALLCSDRGYKVLTPLLYGGRQQDIHSGTMNVPGIGAMLNALTYSQDHYFKPGFLTEDLALMLRSQLLNHFPRLEINSNYPFDSVPWCMNLYIPNVNTSNLLANNPSLIASTGSSCNSKQKKRSHVLKACGYNDKYIDSCLRLSWDYITFTNADIYKVINILKEAMGNEN